MQKLVYLNIAPGSNSKCEFNEPKEVEDLLSEGYKVVSITSASSSTISVNTFVIVLEK